MATEGEMDVSQRGSGDQKESKTCTDETKKLIGQVYNSLTCKELFHMIQTFENKYIR
jgi:hypothetical protein